MPAITITPRQRALLERYLDELDLWNRRLNLTTVPREAAWERHVVESLDLLAVAEPPAGARCADLGSGAGIPGIVVAAIRADLPMTLIESDRRKAGFLVHVCGLLELGNITVAARRAEELAADPLHRRRYDAVLSRAAAPPASLFALAAPLLAPGGALWALVSEADARAAAPPADPALRLERPSPGVLTLRRLPGDL